ncbi:MAG: ABC transporter permease, partial [Muribaculaceae bacterium]|nr:ABC transporter permease [Muribaculaceae bacterium]
MAIFGSLIKKEALHILRDTRTMVITLLMPLVLLLLFGFAISTEVNDVRIAAVVEQHTEKTREILERFRVNDYFTFLGLTSPSNAECLLRSGEADAVLFLRTDEG